MIIFTCLYVLGCVGLGAILGALGPACLMIAGHGIGEAHAGEKRPFTPAFAATLNRWLAFGAAAGALAGLAFALKHPAM